MNKTRNVVALIMCFILSLCITGCFKTTPDEMDNLIASVEEKVVDVSSLPSGKSKDVYEKILEKYPEMKETFKKVSIKDAKSKYSLPLTNIIDVLNYESKHKETCDTFLAVEAETYNMAKTLESQLTNYNKDLKSNIELYLHNSEAIDSARVIRKDKYVFYICMRPQSVINDNSSQVIDEMENAINSVLNFK